MSKEKSLKASFQDGIFASIALGVTANYITPFMLFIGANNFQIGLLASIPQLFTSIIQLTTTEIAKIIKSRLKTIYIFVFLQALTFFLISLVFFIPINLQIAMGIFLITLNSIFGSMTQPVWMSLMSDTVDSDKYGKYFAWRGKILGFIVFISGLIAGSYLFIVHNKIVGFISLFLLAGICRIISGIYVSKMDDLPVRNIDNTNNNFGEKFSYIQFIRRFKESNFVKFVLFISLFNFATFLAAPFFAVYMLDELKFKYSTYTIIVSSGCLGGLLFLPLWGNFTDKYGNVKIIKTSAIFIVIMPLLWLFSKNPVYLTIVNFFGGYIWSGYNLATVNFIFDAVSSEKRTRCVSYFNFTNGFFIFLGSFIGGWLAKNLPGLILNSSLLTLVFISAVMRFFVNIFMLKSFNEVKKVEKIEDRELLYAIFGLKPMLNIVESVYRYKT